MIDREEIEAKSVEFQIHAANVQRDYVYGWLLTGIFSISPLASQLILKGGNCFRKAYFATTRFSKDLDFSTRTAVDQEQLAHHFNEVCRFVYDKAGVRFHLDRTRVDLERRIEAGGSLYGVRLYFDDFYGKPTEFGISVSLDVTEFDRIYLPTQIRQLIHPYSDGGMCSVPLHCHKLEELLAAKLKCLLQRRHIADLYDLAFAILVNRELDVDRREVVSTFLRKTIFEPAPGVARDLLLGLPFHALKQFWAKYIVCPTGSVLPWDRAIHALKAFIEELFAPFGASASSLAYYPAHIRNTIMESAANRHLVRLRYHRVDRLVEPYSLVFKRRKDGVGQEYFYAFDRVGGLKGPGIKAFLHRDIEGISETADTFEPRYPVELSKAGEYSTNTYFGSSFGGGRSSAVRGRPRRHRWVYHFECRYCAKRFMRLRHNNRLRPHRDRYGNNCHGRAASFISREYR